MKAYCGINCETCDTYIATKNSDNSMKLLIAEKWGNMYNKEFCVDEIYCEGCKSDKLFAVCSGCDIKKCNIDKKIQCCRECDSHPCDRIQRFYKYQEDNSTGVKFM